MDNQLIQLPCGNWVNPDNVTSVVALPDTEQCGGGYVASRVIVRTCDGFYSVREYPTIEAAQAARDAIASQVNRDMRVNADD